MDAPFPDAPEAIAMALFLLIFAEERTRIPNISFRALVLDLYAECLRAAQGERGHFMEMGERIH